MPQDIASECQPAMEQEYAIAPLGFETGADNASEDDIDLSAIAAAMLGFGKRQIADRKLLSKI